MCVGWRQVSEGYKMYGRVTLHCKNLPQTPTQPLIQSTKQCVEAFEIFSLFMNFCTILQLCQTPQRPFQIFLSLYSGRNVHRKAYSMVTWTIRDLELQKKGRNGNITGFMQMIHQLKGNSKVSLRMVVGKAYLTNLLSYKLLLTTLMVGCRTKLAFKVTRNSPLCQKKLMF